MVRIHPRKSRDNKADGSAIILAFLTMMIPLAARANGISAVMGTTALHLMFGNAIIGLIEGLLLMFMLKVHGVPAITVMIVANYSSALAGAGLANLIMPEIGLENALFWARFVPIIFFVVTIAVEWPFCFFLLRKNPNRISKSLWGNLAVNTVTYLAIIPFYYDASDHSFYRLAKIEQSIVPMATTPAEIYFLSRDQKSIKRVALNGTGETEITNPPAFDDIYGLFASKNSAGKWELWIQGWIRNFGVQNRRLFDLPDAKQMTDWNYRDDPERKSQYNFTTQSSSLTGDTGTNRYSVGSDHLRHFLGVVRNDTGERVRLAFESPLVEFQFSSPTLLPQDQAAFSVNGQIALLDLSSMRMGVITKGWYPIVVLK